MTMRKALCFALVPGWLGACSGQIGDDSSAPTFSASNKAGAAIPSGHPGSSVAGMSGAQPAATPSDVAQIPLEPANPDGIRPSGTDYAGAPIYTRFARLTNAQWANSVKDLLKLSAVPETTGLDEPVAHIKDFTNNETLLDVSTSSMVDAYANLTGALVKQVSTDAALSKLYSGTDSAGFIKALGRRAYRRPLTDSELSKYQTLYDAGSKSTATGGAFSKGAALVLETLLQSPHFLYRVESGSANKNLNGYEVAAKLSLWLNETTPSDALLDKAPKLTDATSIATEVKAMLEQPAAAKVVAKFHEEWLEFSHLDDVQKDASLGLAEGFGDELHELSTKYFERIFAQNLGLKEILTGSSGYVGPKTAAVYGVQASSVTLKDFGAQRVGYFAQVPYTALYGSFGGQSNSILRGVHLQHDILCGNLPPPPGAFSLQEQAPQQTNRARVEKATSPELCYGCHGNYLNPLGFAFENFDGAGRLRSTDNGAAVDTSGQYPFPGKTSSFTGHAALMQDALASDMSHVCYAKKIAAYALGRDIIKADEAFINRLAQVSQSNGSMKDVMLALAKDPAFLVRAEDSQ